MGFIAYILNMLVWVGVGIFTVYTELQWDKYICDFFTRQTNVVIACFWRDMGYVAFTRFCCESGFVANTRFFLCLVQTFAQTLKILLRFCADICSKNWVFGPLSFSDLAICHLSVLMQPIQSDVTSKRPGDVLRLLRKWPHSVEVN